MLSSSMTNANASQSKSESDLLATPLQTPKSFIPSAQISAPRAWLSNFIQRTAIKYSTQTPSSKEKRPLFDELTVAVETLSSDQYRNDFAYLEICELIQDEDECRRLYKYLKNCHVGSLHPLFYLQWALFETRAGQPERAQVVIASGLELPLLAGNEELKAAQNGIIPDKSLLEKFLDPLMIRTPAPISTDSFARPSTAPRTLKRLGLGPPKRVVPGGEVIDELTVPHTASSSFENFSYPDAIKKSSQGSEDTFDQIYTCKQTDQLDKAQKDQSRQESTSNQYRQDANQDSQVDAKGNVKSKSIKINGKQYRVLNLVGKGGSSKVFKVMSIEGHIHALKRVGLKNLDDFTFNSYLNEIDLLQRFTTANHPNIIRLIDSEINRQSGYLMILMEYGETDLSKLMAKARPNHSFIRYYFEQMLRAVQSVHNEKIVHCDLKPANFLLVQGTLKLIDFGISKAIMNDTTNIVRENQVGTVNYMSPEALTETTDPIHEHVGQSKKLKIGRPSDIWSLGCILYEMVHGRPPFAHHPTLILRLKHIMDPQSPIVFSETDNIYLDSILRKCLDRNPKLRPSLPELLEHPYIKSIPQSIMITRADVKTLIERFLERSPGPTIDTDGLSKRLFEQWSKG